MTPNKQPTPQARGIPAPAGSTTRAASPSPQATHAAASGAPTGGAAAASASAPAPAPGAPAQQERVFATQAELDAAKIAELFWPTALLLSLQDSGTSKAGVILAYERFRAAAGSPADPVERILLEELWLAHYQIADLHILASKGANAEITKIYSAAAVRLMGEVRRTALAIRAYRQPPSKKSFSVIQQQNIATGGGTQDVKYVDVAKGKATLVAQDGLVDKQAPEGDLHGLRERIARGEKPASGSGWAEERKAAAAVVP